MLPFPSDLSRRTMLGATVGLTALSLAAPQALAQRKPAGGDVAVDELMKKTGVPEMILGNADAKVTIVEFASLTCPACANFSATAAPAEGPAPARTRRTTGRRDRCGR